MPHSSESKFGGRALWLGLIAVSCLVLVLWLRAYGLVLAIPIIAITALLLRHRHDAPETDALRSSIILSAEDIEDVIGEFDRFANSPDTDAMADRTLNRPALLDQDSEHPDIEKFHFHCQTNRRFLNRLEGKLTTDLSVEELEQLLAVTDRRSMELKESWLLARRSAKRLGPGH